MKSVRRFFAFSTIILAASCTVKLDQEILKPELEERVITITARAETGSTTKTELSQAGDGAVLWSPGDEISVFYGNGTDGGSRFTSSATEAVAITDFIGTIETIAGGIESAPEGTWFWGLYPYTPTASCDGSSVTMTLSAEQVATAGTFAPGASPSMGRSKGLSMGFYNICGGVKFTVTHEGIRKVTLRSNGGELIAGTARVTFSDAGLPVVEEILSGTDAITLEAPAGKPFEVGTLYCMMAFPTVLESGFTLTLETMTESAEVEKNGSITITRSILGRMDDVDEGATYTLKYDNVPVQDANFKAYLVENFDTDGDGEVGLAEAEAITEINIRTDEIASVQGIEYMPNLRKLWANSFSNSGELTALDVSNNTALTNLYCGGNELTSLDVSRNTALEGLVCNNNQLASLDVSNNTALTGLSCNENRLTALDVSNNSALTELSCDYNRLTALDVSNNTELTYLKCNNNQLTSLDVSNNTKLTRLYCNNNQLTSLDVSNNTALTWLDCHDNQLTSLDVLNNTVLTNLYCGGNQLTSLDVSKNTALTALWCFGNQLTSLDVSKNTALKELYCYDNQLTTLDVSNNTKLTILNCYNNQLTTLDISNNTKLTNLNCYNNQLTSLDVSSNTKLVWLVCSPMASLQTLVIALGQEISNITNNRSGAFIPDETQIVVASPAGGD